MTTEVNAWLGATRSVRTEFWLLTHLTNATPATMTTTKNPASYATDAVVTLGR